MPTHDLSHVPGVTPEVQEKLLRAGLATPFLLSTASVEQIQAAGIPKSQAEELIGNARDIAEIKHITPSEFAERFFTMAKISTGSTKLDEALGAGIETMTLTEFFGPSASGKSQMCMQLAVNAQLPEESGGLESRVVYIDTEKSFNPGRVENLAKFRGIKPREALKKILYVRVSSLSELFEKANKAEEFLSRRDTRILIIDNIISPFRLESEKRGAHERPLLLQKLLWKLLLYTDELNAAVVFTNRVYSLPDSITGEVIQPFGGLVVDTSVHKKVFLRKHENEVYRASLMGDQPMEVFFRIDKSGVRDL